MAKSPQSDPQFAAVRTPLSLSFSALGCAVWSQAAYGLWWRLLSALSYRRFQLPHFGTYDWMCRPSGCCREQSVQTVRAQTSTSSRMLSPLFSSLISASQSISF